MHLYLDVVVPAEMWKPFFLSSTLMRQQNLKESLHFLLFFLSTSCFSSYQQSCQFITSSALIWIRCASSTTLVPPRRFFLHAWNFTSKNVIAIGSKQRNKMWQNVLQIYWCAMDQMSVSNRISSEQTFAWANLINAEDNVIHLNAVALADNDRNARESKCNSARWKGGVSKWVSVSVMRVLRSLNTLLSSSMSPIPSSLKCMLTMNFSFKFLFVPFDRPNDWLCFHYMFTYTHTPMHTEIEPFAVHISSQALLCKIIWIVSIKGNSGTRTKGRGDADKQRNWQRTSESERGRVKYRQNGNTRWYEERTVFLVLACLHCAASTNL